MCHMYLSFSIKVGSDDDHKWITLRRHENDGTIPRKNGGCGAWAVQSGGQAFRQFRILQFDKGDLRNHYLTCSGIELYGVLHDWKGS